MKNSENHKLDELLKDKLTNGSAAVPDFVWGNIEAELFPKKKRRRFFWWFFSGFGMITLLGVYFLISDSSEVPKMENSEETRNFQSAEKRETSQFMLSEVENNEQKMMHKCFSQNPGKTGLSEDAANLFPGKGAGMRFSQSSGSGHGDPLPFLTANTSRKKERNLRSDREKNDPGTSVTGGALQHGEPAVVILKTDSVIASNESLLPKQETERVDSLALKKAGLEALEYSPLAYNPLLMKDEKRSFFSLNFYGGSSLYNIAVLKDYFISGQLSERTFSSSGFETGLNAMFNITPEFGLYAGLGFNRKQTMFNYNLAVTQEDYFNLVNEETAVPYANIADDGRNSCFIAKGVQADYSIQTVLVSFGGIYELFRIRKFFVGADLRITANLQSSMDLKKVAVLAIPEPVKEKFSYYQPGIGLNMNYQLNKKLAVGISPMFSRQYGRKGDSFYKRLDELLIPVTFRISF